MLKPGKHTLPLDQLAGMPAADAEIQKARPRPDKGLPIEVYLNILSFLNLSTLAAVARCSKAQYEIVLPILYRKLSVRLRSGDLHCSSSLLLRTLSTTPHLRYHIRDVEIINDESAYWCSPAYSKLLNVLLLGILTHPDRIISFNWKAGPLQNHVFFPEMAALECGKILNMTDLLWVRWHLLCCRSLRSVRLNIASRLASITGAWFLSHLSLAHVCELSLRGADLTTMDADLRSLETLELNLCHGMDDFLTRLIASGVPKSLRVLKLAGDISVGRLAVLLSAIVSKVRLDTLSLRIGGVPDLLSPKLIKGLAPAVSTLTLDFREILHDPRTSVKYTVQDFQDIVEALPMLTSIGIALDLRNPKFARYQRLKFKVSVAERC